MTIQQPVQAYVASHRIMGEIQPREFSRTFICQLWVIVSWDCFNLKSRDWFPKEKEVKKEKGCLKGSAHSREIIYSSQSALLSYKQSLLGI